MAASAFPSLIFSAAALEDPADFPELPLHYFPINKLTTLIACDTKRFY
jgi:hypothetical protein